MAYGEELENLWNYPWAIGVGINKHVVKNYGLRLNIEHPIFTHH